MAARLWRRLCLLFAVLVVAGTACAADPPAPIHRIVAIGDLHGDYGAWRDIALAAGLIDAKGRWAGGDTVFVQTGDVVDRGPDSLKIIDDLMRLQKEAPKAHGRVVTLVGNHEAMNVTGDLRYVSAGDYAAFTTPSSAQVRAQTYDANKAAIEDAYHKRDPSLTSDAIRQAWLAAVPLGQIEHQSAWHPDGRIGLWVVGNPAVIELDGTLFVHGGISAAYSQLPLAEINKRVAKALAAMDSSDSSILFADDGPLWYRGLAKGTVGAEDQPKGFTAPADAAPIISTESELQQVLHAYHAKRMVIAHTPILSGIQMVHNDQLIRIDTGISSFYCGTLSFLEIIDGTPTPHVVTRSTPCGKGAG